MVKQNMGKRGVFYTITALLLMSVFLFSFLSITKYRYSTKAFVIETRVNTINDFIGDVERDIERAVFITSHRALLSMIEIIVENQSYIDNVETRFQELFFNGTYKNNVTNFMINNSFDIWEDRIKQKAADLDIDIDFINKSVSVGQEDPWHVHTELSFTLIIGDIKGTANFTKKYDIEADVPIEFFEDPTYRLNTNGLVIKPVIISNFSYFVGSGCDTTNLEMYNDETMYVAFEDAPSYLKRLEGDLSSDENGIESLVNINEFVMQGMGVYDKSIVDYIYFGGSDPTKYHVQGLDSWFKIDNRTGGTSTHHKLYEIEECIG